MDDTALEENSLAAARIRFIRRARHMSQLELAARCGVTQGHISRIETGKANALDSRHFLGLLVTALQVSVQQITGGAPVTRDPVQSAPQRVIPHLRVALTTNRLGDAVTGHARTPGQLRDEVYEVIEPLRRASDLAEAGALLPDVLDELHYHVADPSGEDVQKAALETLVEACVISSVIAKETWHIDLASIAAQRGIDAAVMLGDPVQCGKADFMRLMTMPRESWDRNLAASVRAAEALAGTSDPAGLQVRGMLELTCALTAATARRSGTARQWLEAATETASRVPDEPDVTWQSFSATNVAMWSTAIALEQGENGRAVLDQAKKVDLSRVAPRTSRRAGFYSHIGRAAARDPRTRQEAVRFLAAADKAAPQRMRNSAPFRETVAYLVVEARTAAVRRDLESLARRVGVAV